MTSTTPTTAPTADLAGWTQKSFTAAGITHDCFEKAPVGGGPGVVLIPEIPGMAPEVMGMAQHLVDNGFSVVIPSLFGQPGRAVSAAYMASTIPKLCISKEFRAFATNAQRPVTAYLRALASDLNARTPGAGVGVVGMCFSGGFSLATAVDDAVVAAVASQPSVPFPLGAARKRDPGMSPEEFDALARRTASGEVCLLGLRFSEDKAAPAERFVTLKARLGDRFEVIELDSSKGNSGGFSSSAHCVITREVREEPANEAFSARERVVSFLRENVTGAARQ
ncbi:dienelactone hydrolase [Nakamurella antarctica]|uniref:Dienelactone hydrolase n=1 Tax=Nakamurella antarctica TaxID=1902245 RepID=A0A3G8ZLA8_9ACTN|nr:dienelactone hydrolase family protein [Nakamurella antarctica]AZI57938.1 dienelactone hydrolase [Nakamurella antarctica]